MAKFETSVHNIVCIDDNQIDYFIFQRQLKLSGFIGNIWYYSNPGQALIELKKDFIRMSPDLFIVDYNMPGMNGLECIEKIKKLANQVLPDASIQYVLYSIGNSNLHKALLEKSGIGFIEKPIYSSLIQILLNNISSSDKLNKPPFISELKVS